MMCVICDVCDMWCVDGAADKKADTGAGPGFNPTFVSPPHPHTITPSHFTHTHIHREEGSAEANPNPNCSPPVKPVENPVFPVFETRNVRIVQYTSQVCAMKCNIKREIVRSDVYGDVIMR